jgi:hypothetical protein
MIMLACFNKREVERIYREAEKLGVMMCRPSDLYKPCRLIYYSPSFNKIVMSGYDPIDDHAIEYKGQTSYSPNYVMNKDKNAGFVQICGPELFLETIKKHNENWGEDSFNKKYS